jgi:alpha-L-arabinofuranosidase
LAQIVNVIAPVMTRPDGLWLQTIYHPFRLFSEHARGVSLTPRVEAPEYRAGARGDVPVLDAAATYDAETGGLAVFLINRSHDKPLSVRLVVEDRTLRRDVLCSVLGGGDVKAENGWEARENVKARETRVRQEDAAVTVDIPAPGLAVVQLGTVKPA